MFMQAGFADTLPFVILLYAFHTLPPPTPFSKLFRVSQKNMIYDMNVFGTTFIV